MPDANGDYWQNEARLDAAAFSFLNVKINQNMPFSA